MKILVYFLIIVTLTALLAGCLQNNSKNTSSSYMDTPYDEVKCNNDSDESSDNEQKITEPCGELIQLLEQYIENTSAREAFLSVLNGDVDFHAVNFESDNDVWFIDEFVAQMYERRFAFIQLENEEIPIILFLDAEDSGENMALLLHYYNGTIYGTFDSRRVMRGMGVCGYFWHIVGPGNVGTLFKTGIDRDQLVFTELSSWIGWVVDRDFMINDRIVTEEELREFIEENDNFESPVWHNFER